jgi:hypothetical protein
MTYRAKQSPLIAVYEDSGQTITVDGVQRLQFDTVLHDNGSIDQVNEYNIEFNSFLTSDMKTNGSTGFGGRLMMDLDSTRLDGKGSVISGDISSTSAGVSNEIIASNVNPNVVVELYIQRGSSGTITLNAFTRIIGVITS